MDPATFLQTQSTEYQHHLTRIKELTATLEHQLIIQSYQTIPKEYLLVSHIDSIRLLKIEIRVRIDYRASHKPALYRHSGVWERQKQFIQQALFS